MYNRLLIKETPLSLLCLSLLSLSLSLPFPLPPPLPVPSSLLSEALKFGELLLQCHVYVCVILLTPYAKGPTCHSTVRRATLVWNNQIIRDINPTPTTRT